MIASQASAANLRTDTNLDARALQTWLARTALALLVVLATILAARRAAAALDRPLPTVTLGACGVFLAILAAAARRAPARQVSWQLLPTILLLVSAGCLSLRGSPWAGLGLLWGFVLAEEAWHWQRRSRPVVAPPRMAPAPAIVSAAHDDADEVESLDLRQNLLRGVDADGADVLRGEVQAVFAAGQRIEHVHLSFCPPFERTPEFDFEQVDGPDARIELAQLLPYGARLELKLSQPGPARVKIAVSARLMPDSAGSVTDN